MQENVISKTKEVDLEVNRSYNHVKCLVDTDDEVRSNYNTWRRLLTLHSLKFSQAGNHDADQLDGKQRHTGFNNNEYDIPKFGTPG